MQMVLALAMRSLSGPNLGTTFCPIILALSMPPFSLLKMPSPLPLPLSCTYNRGGDANSKTRKEMTTPCGVSLTSSQLLYRAAQDVESNSCWRGVVAACHTF